MQAQEKIGEFDEKISNFPSIFIGHGSPLVAIEYDDWNDKIGNFIDGLDHPTSIIIMSAHWETEDTIEITSSKYPKQLYDFDHETYPDTLLQLTYPVNGDAELASHVKELLSDKFGNINLNDKRGLDHGSWIPMYVFYPNVDVNVIQISIPKSFSPGQIFEIGKRLSPLRDNGILLVGSGNIVNNTKEANFEKKYTETDEWAIKFDQWVNQKLIDLDFESLLNMTNKAPFSEKALKGLSHIMPLFFILGTFNNKDTIITLFDGFHYGNISMRSFALIS